MLVSAAGNDSLLCSCHKARSLYLNRFVVSTAQPPSPTPEYACQGNEWNLASPPNQPRSVELRLTIEKGVPCVYNKIGRYFTPKIH